MVQLRTVVRCSQGANGQYHSVTSGDALLNETNDHHAFVAAGSPIPMPASTAKLRLGTVTGKTSAFPEEGLPVLRHTGKHGTATETTWAASSCPSPGLSGAHIPGQLTVAPRVVPQTGVSVPLATEVNAEVNTEDTDDDDDASNTGDMSPSPSPLPRSASASLLMPTLSLRQGDAGDTLPRTRSKELSVLLRALSSSVLQEEGAGRRTGGGGWRQLHNERKKEFKLSASVRDSQLSTNADTPLR